MLSGKPRADQQLARQPEAHEADHRVLHQGQGVQAARHVLRRLLAGPPCRHAHARTHTHTHTCTRNICLCDGVSYDHIYPIIYSLLAGPLSRYHMLYIISYSSIIPPAYLKVHTASYHFLGNGKIRSFWCSLLFSGVASVTHHGLQEALSGL